MHMLATLNRGRASICAMTLPANAWVVGQTLRDLPLPQGSLVISVVRGEKMIIPNGETVFAPGDEIVAVCEGRVQHKLENMLIKRT